MCFCTIPNKEERRRKARYVKNKQEKENNMKAKALTFVAILVLFLGIQVNTSAKTDEVILKLEKIMQQNEGKTWQVKLNYVPIKEYNEVLNAIKEKERGANQTWRIFPCYGGSIIISNCSYTVQAGDTWASIASKYGLTQTQLKMMNVFYQSFELVEGMKVRVKWM